MTTLHLVLGVFLLASTHAQSDFCEDGPTRLVRKDESAREEMETKIYALGDKGAFRAKNNNHDLVEGNCTELTENVKIEKECIKAPSSGVLVHYHRYFFPENIVITCIKTLDRHEDGRGGFPSRQEGGVGSNMVWFEYNSQEKQGLKFHTEMFYKYR